MAANDVEGWWAFTAYVRQYLSYDFASTFINAA